MAGWWSKAVSAVGDKIGLDEDSQAAITSAGTNLGTKVGGIVTQVQEHAAEMSADSQRWQEEADARRAAEARKQEAARLPWEVDAADEAKSILSQDLMERVLALSLDERTFLDAAPRVVFEFDFEAHVPVIMRLLELDPNLAKMHSRLAPKVDEEVFWRRFFLRCAQLRVRAPLSPARRRPRAAASSRGEGSARGSESGARVGALNRRSLSQSLVPRARKASVGIGMPLPISSGPGEAGATDASSSDGSAEVINKDELLREMADDGLGAPPASEAAARRSPATADDDAAAAAEDAALEAEVQAELERGAGADESFDDEAQLCSELDALDADAEGLDDELEAQIAAELDDEDAAKAAS